MVDTSTVCLIMGTALAPVGLMMLLHGAWKWLTER